MEIMWQQLPALLGVGVGVLASYLVAGAGERARWRRTQQARWVERRLDAYQQYGYAVKRMTTLAMRLAAAQGVDDSTQPRTPVPDGLAALAEAEAERSARWETVLLVGDPTTVTAARRWHESAWLLEQFARGEAPEATGWQHAVEQMRASRHAYYAAARQDLGVGSGDLPDPPVVGPGAHQRPAEPE